MEKPPTKISVLGSTGSIGVNTLKLAEKFPDRLKVVGLAAGRNKSALLRQIRKFRPARVAIGDSRLAADLRTQLREQKIKIFSGPEGLQALAAAPGAEKVVLGISGSAGLQPALAALQAGKQLALANKEALVMGGELLLKQARRSGGSIIPVDSEHSALFQLLEKQKRREVECLYLPATGGPFLHRNPQTLNRVTPREALSHPVWKMGKKVSIDSATLMNKGLEIIEAHYLFRMPGEKIKVLIHPQGQVHALIRLRDGAFLAHMGIPDMRIPIAYALSYPDRWELNLPSFSLPQLGKLSFAEADEKRFPALRLAYLSLQAGRTMPAVLSAANEAAVELFLRGAISFSGIVQLVAEALEARKENPSPSLEAIEAAADWAHRQVKDNALKRR